MALSDYFRVATPQGKYLKDDGTFGWLVNPRFDAGDSGASITINWTTNGNHQRTRLTSATVTITLAGGVAGGVYALELLQDPTGSRVPTITGVDYGTDGTPTWSTTASRYDMVSFYYNGTEYINIGFKAGFTG